MESSSDVGRIELSEEELLDEPSIQRRLSAWYADLSSREDKEFRSKNQPSRVVRGHTSATPTSEVTIQVPKEYVVFIIIDQASLSDPAIAIAALRPESVLCGVYSVDVNRRRAIVHGFLKPRYVISSGRDNDTLNMVLSRSTRVYPSEMKHAEYPALPTPPGDAVKCAEAYAQPTESTTGCIDWIKRLRKMPASTVCNYYMTEDTDQRKGARLVCYSIKELAYYKGYIKRMTACTRMLVKSLLNTEAINNGSTGRSFSVPDSSEVQRMESFLLEEDLTDPSSRELDWKARQLFLLLMTSLALKARSKRMAQECNQTALDVALKAMQQAIAWQIELRHRYIFFREGSVLNLCKNNGCDFIVFSNKVVSPQEIGKLKISASHVKDTGSSQDLGDRAIPFMRRILADASSQQRVHSLDIRYETIKECKSEAAKLLASGTNLCVRWDAKQGEYVIYYENVEMVKSRLPRTQKVSSGTESYSLQYLSPISKTEDASADTSDLSQVIIDGLPVVVYFIVEKSRYSTIVSGIVKVLDEIIRTDDHWMETKVVTDQETGIKTEKKVWISESLKNSVLYCSKAYGDLKISDFVKFQVPKKDRKNGVTEHGVWNDHEFVLCVLPAVVIKSVSHLRAILAIARTRFLKQNPEEAKWMYPGGEVVSPMIPKDMHIYDNGYKFSEWGGCLRTMTFEMHPPPAFFEFEAESHIRAYNRICTPTTIRSIPFTQDQWKPLCELELSKFMISHPYDALPNFTIGVYESEIDHSIITPRRGLSLDSFSGGSSGCTFTSEFTKTDRMDCFVCSKRDILRTNDDEEGIILLNYKDVPGWQYSLCLKNVRLLLEQLDEDAKYSGPDDPVATCKDLDDWVTKEANLGTIWTHLKECFYSELNTIEGLHAQAIVDYDKQMRLASDAQRVIAGLPDTGPMDPEERKDRIKRWISMVAETFYIDQKGHPKVRDGRTIRYGDNNHLAVFVTRSDSSLAGGFKNYKTGESGDVFQFIITEIFGMKDGSNGFFAKAVDFAHAWLVKSFGPNVLDSNPGVKGSVAIPDELKSKIQEQNKKVGDESARRVKDARETWKLARKLTRDHEHTRCTLAVNYLASRGIVDERVVYDSGFARFHPSFVTKEDEDTYQNPALIVAVIDPLDKSDNPAVFGLQGVLLDASSSSKTKTFTVQKKSKGDTRKGAVRVQKGSDDPDAITRAQFVFKAAIAIGEGPETMASVAQACPELAVWCTLGIENIPHFPYIGDKPWGSGIIYCADNDRGDTPEKRQMKSRQVSNNVKSLTDKGYTVFLCMPKHIERDGAKGTDFNDIVMLSESRAVADRIIRKTISEAAEHVPTCPDHEATAAVGLTEDGGRIAPLPKRSKKEEIEEHKKRKASAIEELRSKARSKVKEEPPREEKKEEKEKKKEEEDEKPEPKKKARPSSPPPQESSSSSSSGEEEKEKETKDTKKKKKAPIPIKKKKVVKAKKEESSESESSSSDSSSSSSSSSSPGSSSWTSSITRSRASW